MKKNLNKLATLALTGMMVAGMSFGAMADTVGGDQQTNFTVRDSFSFDKYLKIVGTNDSVPHVTFTFTAEPYSNNSDEGSMLNIEAANTLNVYNGVTGNEDKKVTGDVAFTGSEIKDADSKVKKVVTLKNGTDDVTFTKAGVYRYRVTESFEQSKNSDFYTLYNKVESVGSTTTVTKSSIKSNTNEVEYIDVYVQYRDSAYKITNVVLMKEDPGSDGLSVDEDNEITYSDSNGKAKLAGVENEYTTKHEKDNVPDGEDNAIILTKKLGATGFQNKSKEFTFNVAFTNVPDGFVVTYAKKGASDADYGTASTWTYDGRTQTTLEVKLKADESVKITGIPAGIKYKVTETSDSNYTPSVKVDSTELNSANGGVGTNDWVLDERSLSDDLVDDIEWTNTQNDITVTGVAMNIAPYAAMVLGAGAFAGIFLGGKRRKAEDED